MRQRGQASLEYVGVLGLVAVALAAAVLVARADLAVAVASALERGLCVVLGGDCRGERPRPCVLGVRADERIRSAGLLVARLADGRLVTRERRSDGTWAVSVADRSDAGVELQLGGRLRVGGRAIRLGATAGGGAALSAGRTWVVPDAAAADRLVARVAGRRAPVGEALLRSGRFLLGRGGDGAAERWVEGGLRAVGDARAGLLGAGPRAEALLERGVGLRVDALTGRRAVALRSDKEIDAALAAPLARIAGGTAAERSVELVLDRRGRLEELRVLAARAVDGAFRSPVGRGQGGDRVEVEGRLPLRDATDRRLAVVALLGEGAPPWARAAAAAAAARRILARGRVDARVYETAERRSERGLELALGVQAGGSEVRAVRIARLVGAWGRDPGGPWRERLDCRG